MTKKTNGNRLFSFAVIADTHINQSETECNSPFEVNRLANRRMRHVVNDINRRELALVVHLGDVVHPVPSMGTLYADSANRFFEQVKDLKYPLHVIPGNHDVGDKPISWGPAGTVNEEFLDAWSRYFGEHYFRVSHDGIEFLGINAQVIGSGLPLESEQKEWLEDILQTLKGERIFLFSHYPPFLAESSETEHYDNLGETGRRWLLKLIKDSGVEGLFAGHVHNFWYNRFGGCDCYLALSTAFVRHDYSEIFRVPPNAEHGRNDAPKLGYFVVHVFEHGHTLEVVRTYGIEVGLEKQSKDSVVIVQPSPKPNSVLGFDLRQDWTEQVQIPPSGGLDEFDRKSIRNDYGLLALLDMGVRKLRVPISDLLAPSRRSRLEDLAHLGFEFTLYTFGVPEAAQLKKIQQHRSLLTSWEITWPQSHLDELDRTTLQSLSNDGLALFFSPLRSKAEIIQTQQKYYHVINHGFTIHDVHLSDTLAQENIRACFQGYVIRLGLHDNPWQAGQLAQEVEAKTGLTASVHLRIAGDNPAESIRNTQQLCDRLAGGLFSGWAYPASTFFCDTFADNDRGYFPRIGVVDRLYNPQPGFHIVRNLHAVLGGLADAPQNPRFHEKDSITIYQASTASGTLALCLLSNNQPSVHCLVELESVLVNQPGSQWINGLSGAIFQSAQDCLSSASETEGLLPAILLVCNSTA